MQLRKATIKRNQSSDYPFSIPFIKNNPSVEFNSSITIIVGENGTGKSTFLEGLAIATGLPIVGANDAILDKTLEPARSLAKQFELTWSIRNHRGFFMRAEDFFGFQKRISTELVELKKQKKDFSERFTGYGKLLATGSTENQLHQLEKRYGENPDAFSHGESFLNLFNQRLVPKGLYILDEPEVPLSPKRQLSLISMIKEQLNQESQFIIATHSPILMAFPEATILEIQDHEFKNVKYQDLEHVILMRDFLSNPEMFFKYL